MKTVYLVIQHIPYEGDTVMRVYDNWEDADEYAKILEKEDECYFHGFCDYNVKEEKLHTKVPAWSLANDDHN